MPAIESAYQKREGRRGERRTDLLCRIKYTNTLPDIPFDPKFIQYPFDPNRFVQYNPTSLVNNNKWELLVEQDVGVPIDLVNPDKYAISPNQPPLHPSDEKLLEDETSVLTNSNRAQLNARIVPWLRKTEYIGSNVSQFGFKNERAETRSNSLKSRVIEEDFYFKKENRIKAIEDSFEAAKMELINHYSKPGVHKVEEWYIFPDEELWCYPCAQVIFDDDPAPKEHSAAEQIKEMSQAMIRGMIDADGDQFVGYFLPTAETMQKRKNDEEMGIDYDPDEEYDYKMIREYNWNVKNKSTRGGGYEENYFFIIRDDGIYYNELETKVRLSKRRLKGFEIADSRIVVKHREFTEAELRKQKRRLRQLQNIPTNEEDEEHEEEEEEEEDEEEEEEEEEEVENVTDVSRQQEESTDSHIQAKKSPLSESDDNRSLRNEENRNDEHREDEAGARKTSAEEESTTTSQHRNSCDNDDDGEDKKADEEEELIESGGGPVDEDSNVDDEKQSKTRETSDGFLPSFSQYY